MMARSHQTLERGQCLRYGEKGRWMKSISGKGQGQAAAISVVKSQEIKEMSRGKQSEA